MLVKDRPRLTRQALDSLVEHTIGDYRLTILDDQSAMETSELVDSYQSKSCQIIHSRYQTLGPGRARNIAIDKASKAGRGDLLYLCDNDCYFLPNWDAQLLAVWPLAQAAGFQALGGCCHPYQLAITQNKATAEHSVNELAALGLLSWLMTWETWDHYGPFDPSPTINGSEDWLMSQKIRKAGGKVGVVSPAVVLNCGVTSTDGKQCPGAKMLWEQTIPAGVIVE